MSGMTSVQTEGIAQALERAYVEEDWDRLGEVYRPDVLLDVNVPLWRFQLKGADAAVTWFKQTSGHFRGYRVPWTRVTASDELLVIEWELRTDGDDGENLCREVDLLRLDDGQVTEHVIFCTGMWDAATVARQRAEAPIIRW